MKKTFKKLKTSFLKVQSLLEISIILDSVWSTAQVALNTFFQI